MIKETERIVYDIPKIEIKVFKFIIEVDYLNGKLVCIAEHLQLPKQGMIGNNLQSFLVELKHNFAGSYERVSDFLENLTGIEFTGQAIKDSLIRTTDNLYLSYEKMECELEKEKSVNADETCWPVNGDKFWLWVLYSINIIFITITNSRGRRVVTDILGEQFLGVITSDCLKVYGKFATAFQGCWAHLLRYSHFESKKHCRKKKVVVFAEV